MYNINIDMNNTKDFHKKDNGVVVNTNRKDYQRARNRNFMRREQEKIVGEDGKIASLEKEVLELKRLLQESLKRR